jgi:hypothetical protein
LDLNGLERCDSHPSIKIDSINAERRSDIGLWPAEIQMIVLQKMRLNKENNNIIIFQLC